MRINTHRIELLSFKLIRALVRGLSVAGARKVGSWGGLLSYYGFLNRRRYTLRNLALVFPELSARERRALARTAFRRSGSSLLESMLWSTKAVAEELSRFDVIGREHLERLLESGKGFIIMGAHYGVWEIGLAPFEKQVAPIVVIAKRTTNPLMQEEADAWRERRGFVQVLSKGATLRIFKALKKGQRAGFIADQRVQPDVGILVPFLGEPAWTSPMMAAMSLRAQVPVIPHFSEPLGDDRYRLTYLEPIEPDVVSDSQGNDSHGDEAIRLLTERYNAVLEERIRAQPELWFWVHERWRRIKRYNWNSTKELWLKRSGLAVESRGPQAVERHGLSTALLELVRSYRKGPPLQNGSCVQIRGGTSTELGALRSAGIALGHAVINAGRSYRWIDLAADNPANALDDTNEDLDQFDVTALLLPCTPSEGQREAVTSLVRHRLLMKRSVAFLLREGDREEWASLTGLVTESGVEFTTIVI